MVSHIVRVKVSRMFLTFLNAIATVIVEYKGPTLLKIKQRVRVVIYLG